MKNIATNMQRRIRTFAIGAAILSVFSLLAQGAEIEHVKWDNLSTVVGKTVMVAMPAGSVITGEATGVESDALVVNVTKTTDRTAFPKGELRVPRATLRVFQVRTKGKICRVLLTVAGAVVGMYGGASVAIGIGSGGAFGKTSTGAVAAFIGIGFAGTVAGYEAGDAADRRWTAIEIVP
jgi:hypothetical protein